MSPRSTPPPALTQLPTPGPLPVVAGHFEAEEAGEGVLLRVHVDGIVDRSDTKLILEDAAGFYLLSPTAPSGSRVLGFELPSGRIGRGARFWLEVGGRAQRLGVPVHVAA